MGLGKLFSFKRSKPKEAVEEKTVSTEKEETEQPKANNANIVYPFHDVKATSFPPPLSIDASVYTDPKNVIATRSESQQITEIPDKNGKQVPQQDEQAKEEIEDDKTHEEQRICDSKTCTKEKCTSETCAKGRQNGGQRDSTFKKQDDVDEKIGQDKLTEMINSSIKEAMQTIVKQCRMDGEKDRDKKVKDLDRSVCRRKSKYDYRSRQRSRKSGMKSGHFREKRDLVLSKRLHDAKSPDKKDEEKCKKRKKLDSNARTDNRKMTGNVNIYICSEANENTQPAKSKKEQQPCTESSSETTTNRSGVCTSKLVTCIRNKRRKLKEQNSLNLLRKKDESSNSSSLVSKSTDSNVESGQESNDFIDVCKEMMKKDTDSSLTECECKDSSDATLDGSDQSFRRAKFVVCNNLEKPCSTIYPSKMPSKTDSEEWSSKSICSSRNDYSSLDTLRGSVPCDKKRGQPEFDYRYANNSKEDYETKRKVIKICRCRKQDREPLERRRTGKENFVQPLSTCACIAEEEEDVCVDVEDCQKSPRDVCRNVPRSSERAEEKFVACTEATESAEKEKEKPEEKVKTAKEERIDEDETKKEEASRLTSSKLMRPEVVVLKNILKQSKPAVQSNISTRAPKVNLTEQPSNNPSNSQAKTEPAFLKKFNLREQHKFLKRSDAEEGETSQKLKEEVPEATGNEEVARKSFSEKVKNSLFYKTFRKVVDNVSPERKSGGDDGKDTIAEDTKDSTDKKTEAPKTGGDDQLTDSKEPKAKEKFIPGINIYKMLKKKKSKKEPNVALEKTPGKTDEGDAKPVSTGAEEQKDDLQEAAKKDGQEKEKDLQKKGKKDVQEKEKKDDLREKKDVLQKKEKKNDLQEQKGKSKEETTEQQEDKVKSIATAKKEPLSKDIEKEKQTDSKIERVSKPQEARIESGPPKYPEIRKKSDQLDPETKKVAEDRPKRMDTHSEEATVCAQCVRRKSLHKESKQFVPSQCLQVQPSEPHTTCVNSKFTRCTDVNNNYPLGTESFNESRCNCCYVPVSQCTDEFINHPKSCLKKERQFRCVNSQETNASILCCDKRNWEECGCRRMVFCENCRRPRTECCCRCTYVSCTNCCKPRSKCSCKSICKSRSTYGKSMFCLYCDNPREKCTCRAPLVKCSYCELSTDLCRCNQKTIRDGRPVLTEPDNDRTMYVTAWKPREEIRRYFSRKLDVLRTDSINECWCHEKLKHHNSDDLPYQRLSVFSDVMDELQQKLSESTCCTRCRKIPCCCNIEADEGRDERKICCVSPKTRRKLVAVCVEKPIVKSLNNYKCDIVKEKNDRQRKIIVSLCCECKSTPCRCKKNKSSQKKPRAKCYYCKNSPCICIASGDCNKPRPCRCTDSPRRTKEKENAPRGKTSTKPKNNDEKIICVR